MLTRPITKVLPLQYSRKDILNTTLLFPSGNHIRALTLHCQTCSICFRFLRINQPPWRNCGRIQTEFVASGIKTREANQLSQHCYSENSFYNLTIMSADHPPEPSVQGFSLSWSLIFPRNTRSVWLIHTFKRVHFLCT